MVHEDARFIRTEDIEVRAQVAHVLLCGIADLGLSRICSSAISKRTKRL